jgi:predicted metal-dependent peptidase
MDAERRIKKAIIALQVDQPFFAFLAMNVKLRKMPENSPYKTMGVDANFNLYYDEDFINTVIPTDNIRKGCICHEVLHIALDHLGRVGARYRILANVAQDMVVNMICEKNGLMILKKPEYVNADASNNTAWANLGKAGKIVIQQVSEKSWERIYNEIIDKLENSGYDAGDIEEEMTSGGTTSLFDEHMHESFNKLSKEEQNQVREQLHQMLSDAMTYSKQMGKTPMGVERYVTELLNPKIPWQTTLLKYLKDHTEANDWTYRRPHRKSYSLGVYLPSILNEKVNVDVIVDTSGSIDQESYNEFISEVHGMIRVIPNIQVNLHFVDTEIRKTVTMSKSNLYEILDINPQGGGGTNMEHGLQQIKDLNNGSELVVVLTDGFTNCERSCFDFGFDIIWVICKKGLEEDRAKKYFRYGKVLKM